MYAWSKRKARQSAVPGMVVKQRELLFLFPTGGGVCRSAFRLSLRFGLFESLLRFGGLLGASFRTLFVLLVENLLSAEQLQKSLIGAVALLPHRATDPCVSAVAIAKPRTNGVK